MGGGQHPSTNDRVWLRDDLDARRRARITRARRLSESFCWLQYAAMADSPCSLPQILLALLLSLFRTRVGARFARAIEPCYPPISAQPFLGFSGSGKN